MPTLPATPFPPATVPTVAPTAPGAYVPRTTRTREERLGESRSVGVCLHQIDYGEIPDLARERSAWLLENRYSCDTQVEGSLASRSEWFGGLASVAEARRLLEHGWPEGLARILSVRDRLALELPKPQTIKRRPVWIDAGDELSLDRLRSGRLDQMWWVARRAHGRAPRTVSIVAEIGGDCARDQDQMFWAGGAALILTDLLEQAGYRVELSTGFASRGHAAPYTVNVQLVRLKEAREPLRADVVANAVAHAGFFRYWCLMMMGHHPSRLDAQQGRPTELAYELERLAAAGRLTMPDVVCERVSDDRSVIQTVRDALATVTGDASLRAT